MMNYIGIALTSYDIDICKVVADKLVDKKSQVDIFSAVMSESDSVSLHNIEKYLTVSKRLVYQSFTNDIKFDYLDKKLIIKTDDIKQKYRDGYVPIIIIPDEFLEKFTNHPFAEKIMMFRIDDNNLYKNPMLKKYNKCTYRIDSTHYDQICDLIEKLWQYRNSGGALSKDMVTKMLRCNMLIQNAKFENISYASYDLSLGDEYYYNGKVRTLDNNQPFLPIEPYDYIIASTKEMIAFPRDVVGRFDLVVGLFFEGIILSNSTQVDPGFNGKLFCLLFNTSNKTVYLKRGMKFSTIEFNKLIEPTEAYNGSHAYEDSMISYLPRNIMNGAINELKKDVEKLRSENTKMQQLYIASLAIMIAVLALKSIGG